MAANFYRGTEFKTPTGRLSFAQSLFKPRAAEQGGREKFGCTLIFPNEDKPAFEKALVEVLENQWPKDGIDRFKRGLIKSPILAGDGKEAHNKKTGVLNPGMGADVFFIRTSATVEFPPAVRWRSATIPATEEEVYSGCYGFAVLNAFAWNDPRNGDGISFGIRYFQKTGEGEKFGGDFNPEKYFQKIEDTGPAPEATKGGAGAAGLFS